MRNLEPKTPRYNMKHKERQANKRELFKLFAVLGTVSIVTSAIHFVTLFFIRK
jgi:hypothetical protein